MFLVNIFRANIKPGDFGSLTGIEFEILLSLAGGDLHGYAILQEIGERSAGALTVRPGTLYRAISRLLDAGLIAELDGSLILKHWLELSKGTLAEHAQLHFRLKEAEVQCMACFGIYHPQDGKIHCPRCGSYGAKILSGEEFDLESIELEHEEK